MTKDELIQFLKDNLVVNIETDDTWEGDIRVNVSLNIGDATISRDSAVVNMPHNSRD